jgi:hypothetical protein
MKQTKIPLRPIALALTLAFSGAALGQTTWDGTADTDWANGGNWGGTAPGSSSTVIIDDDETNGNAPEITASGAEADTIDIGGSAYNSSLTVGASGELTTGGDVTVTGGSISGKTGTLTIDGAGTSVCPHY